MPPGVEARRVEIQLDEGALNKIPGDERTSVQERQDLLNDGAKSDPEHSTGRAIPIIFVVVGVLSIPVIWNTIREMLRRDYYGGVLIDGRRHLR